MTTPVLTDRRPFYVVPHTHWDREWYRPFEAYRYRLVETLDGLLAADLPYFLLDGQTVVLEDYLAIRPEQAAPIARRIADGRLGLGPWYVQADEFLVSGESLVRNLLEGRRTMKALGASGAVGYLPDMFGHIAQMPQILKGFGLDHAVLWRGAAPSASRFVWKSPDGTEVVTAWLPQGYYQTMFLVELSAEERLKQVTAYADAFAPDEPVLLLSGADHMAPRADLMPMLEEVTRELPLDAQVTPLLEAIRGTGRPSASLDGELRVQGRPFAYILPGVLSTRTYLKQANVACQTLLERHAEPLTALAWAAGAAYPEAFMRHAWKELMKNQPHDSICGCSIDQVHREMMPRFAAVRQLHGELTATAVGAYCRPVAEPGVYVFNPTGWAHEAWVDVVVHWPAEGAPETVHLTTEDGRVVPAVLTKAETTEIFRAEVDFNPDWFPVRRYALTAQVALPSLGGVRLKAVAGSAPAPSLDLASGAASIENAHVKLEVAGDRLTLTDKATGRVWDDCHAFYDEGDAGDEYNFSPLAEDEPVRAAVAGARVLDAVGARRVLEVTYRLEVPAKLAADRQSRGAERVSLEVTSRFTLEADAHVVSVETRFDNRAEDHRLRVVTRFGAGECPAVWAEGSFGVFRREAAEMPPLPVARGEEAGYPEFPQAGFTALERPEGGLAIFNQGLHEGQVFELDGAWAIATTLVRAVGWLSRDDLRTRGGGAGPRFPTPEGQCPGEQVFHYALAPYTGSWTTVQPLAHRFAAPAAVWEGGGLASGSAVSLGHEALVVSALKKADASDHLVVRVYNPTPEPVESSVTFGVPHEGAWEATLAEEPQSPVGTNPHTARFRPYEIKTWLLGTKRPG